MTKDKRFVSLIIIIILALLGLSFVFPKYINKGIDFLNPKLKALHLPLNLPHFPDVPFKLGLDLKGGSRLVYEADLSSIERKEQGQAMQGLRDVIERRINLFGVAEPLVATQEVNERYRLNIELAGVMEVQKAIEMIGKTPFLEFKNPKPQEETDKILAARKELEGKTPEELQESPDFFLALQDPYFSSTNLTGRFLKKATLSFNSNTSEPEVLMEFNDEGAKIFEDLTSQNIGKQIAIYIDDVLISAPRVNEKISGGKAQITGKFTLEEAKELVRNLNAGALPVPINLVSQATIGPTLGVVSLQKSLKAGIFGFLAVVLFMMFIFRFSGFLASIALSVYLVILLSLFKLIPVTLTLAGIGGAILSIGMAVDANVLIFARMKEERKKEESFEKSIQVGFLRAWPSIRDSNVTTLLLALFMFSFGTSFVKGFALTLSLGVMVSMFSALFVTKIFLRMFVGTRLEKMRWLWG